MNVGVISLGCDKNRCNAEVMLHNISKANYTIVNDINEADVVIVNTCAFIESARKESIDTILEVAQLKEVGKLKKLIVTGCLPEKYIDEIYDAIPEVDGFLGVKDYPLIDSIIKDCLKGNRVNGVGKGVQMCEGFERYLTTPLHYAYLMIADGCNNHCTYCTIPQIRGRFRSKKIEELVAEAENLRDQGVKELIFVAQDVTNYGSDIYGEIKLVELIKKITAIDGIAQVRLLYCYPEKVSNELIEEIKTNDKVAKYIDIPLQHASTTVLKRMGRLGRTEMYERLFSYLKEQIPGIAIRSTVMVGFPGETDEEFEELINFLNSQKPINCGAFIYSDEEDASSSKLPNKITERVKKTRYNKLLQVLEIISTQEKEKLIGQTLDVIYEDIDFEKNRFVGRSYISAPDIDSLVFFTSDDALDVGNYYKVKITAIENDDLIGEVV